MSAENAPIADSAPPAGNALAQGWLVLLLAVLYGGGLAGVQYGLAGTIANNQRQETLRQIPELIPAADDRHTRTRLLRLADGSTAPIYQAFDAQGQHCGWVVPAAGQGFADRIDILIGLDASLDTVTGLWVLAQKETPGLGDYIAGSDFRDRFQDKATDQQLQVVKRPPQQAHEIQAVTGATVSSLAVAEIVNRALAEKCPLIEALDPSATEHSEVP